jgi:nucleotide-binding universal stress UspA family protein
MFRTILAAIDSTDRSAAVLHTAENLARADHAEVRVLHVDPDEVAFDTSADAEDDAEARAVVHTAVQLLDAAGVPASGEVIHAVEGDIGRTIVQTATAAGADLVVLGPHHRRGLDAWLGGSGSVSDDVVRLATRLNVLLVR